MNDFLGESDVGPIIRDVNVELLVGETDQALTATLDARSSYQYALRDLRNNAYFRELVAAQMAVSRAANALKQALASLERIRPKDGTRIEESL